MAYTPNYSQAWNKVHSNTGALEKAVGFTTARKNNKATDLRNQIMQKTVQNADAVEARARNADIRSGNVEQRAQDLHESQVIKAKLDNLSEAQKQELQREVMFHARMATFPTGTARDAELDRIEAEAAKRGDTATQTLVHELRELKGNQQDDHIARVIDFGQIAKILQQDPHVAQSATTQDAAEIRRLRRIGTPEAIASADLIEGKYESENKPTEKQWIYAKRQEMIADGASPEDIANFNFSVGAETGEDQVNLQREKTLATERAKLEAGRPEKEAQEAADALDTINELEATAEKAEYLVANADDDIGGFGSVIMSQFLNSDQTAFNEGVKQLLERMGLGGLRTLKKLSSTGASGLGATSQMEISMLQRQIAFLRAGMKPSEKLRQLQIVVKHHKLAAAAIKRDRAIFAAGKSGEPVYTKALAADLKNQYKLEDKDVWRIVGGDPSVDRAPQFVEARAMSSMAEFGREYESMPSETIKFLVENARSPKIDWGATASEARANTEKVLAIAAEYEFPPPPPPAQTGLKSDY